MVLCIFQYSALLFPRQRSTDPPREGVFLNRPKNTCYLSCPAAPAGCDADQNTCKPRHGAWAEAARKAVESGALASSSFHSLVSKLIGIQASLWIAELETFYFIKVHPCSIPWVSGPYIHSQSTESCQSMLRACPFSEVTPPSNYGWKLTTSPPNQGLIFPKPSSCHWGRRKLRAVTLSWGLGESLSRGLASECDVAPAEPSEESFLRGRRCVRLNTCGFFSRLWNLHSVPLGKNSVYLHKCLALGLRNHHVDVNSSEEADSGKDDETVGPDGLLGERQENGRERREEGQGPLRGGLGVPPGSSSVASFVLTNKFVQ